ncbi:MAG: NYN domain-containing protein [Planctomycetes bacterium]|nr:NYN domain-containing protein [Planctomycetota bacterium]
MPHRCMTAVSYEPLEVALQPPVRFSGKLVDRVCIFIDGSNFYHALKDAGLPTNVDFGKLSATLTTPARRLVQTFYYNTPLIRPQKGDLDFPARDAAVRAQQRFFNALRFIPNLTVKFGRFQKVRQAGIATTCPACAHSYQTPPVVSWVEKGVDVMLASDLLTLAFKNHYDVAILVSSDADYKHAIEVVKAETAKTVELHQVAGSKAYDLITACYRPIQPAIIHACLRP